MKIRKKSNHLITGVATGFNVRGLGEIIISYDNEGGMDSDYICDYDVFLPSINGWKAMDEAFKDRDLIPDNYNTRFREPKNDEERQRGWY